VAEFIQRLRDTEVPSRWARKNYPFNQSERPAKDILDRWEAERDRSPRRIHWLPESDKKYLRVYFEVLSRYTREKFKHDEREVEVLEQIRDAIQRDKGTGPAAGGPGGPGTGGSAGTGLAAAPSGPAAGASTRGGGSTGRGSTPAGETSA
jgi:hypothetical protein